MGQEIGKIKLNHNKGNLIIDRDNFDFKEILIVEKGKTVAKLKINEKRIKLEVIDND